MNASPALLGETASVETRGQVAKPTARGFSDQLRIAIVGLSGSCNPGLHAHLRHVWQNARENNVHLVAICDVFEPSREYGRQLASLPKDAVFGDHRQMLSEADFDAIIVSTHEPLRAQICLDAMDAGKHVYCELPITRYLGEAFQVYDKAKSTGIVYQAGALSCSSAGAHKSAELVRSGKVGELVWGHAYYCRNNPKGEWNYLCSPEMTEKNIDWATWLGPVKQRNAFSAEHFNRWQKYYAYSTGLGAMMSNRLFAMLLATGNPEYPLRVNCVSTRNVQSDRPNAPEREVPEQLHLQVEFPSGLLLHLTCSTVSARSRGCTLYGHQASLNLGVSGESVELVPEEAFADRIEAETYTGLQADDLQVHHRNWFECIRSGRRANADIELALRVQTIVSLAEMSDRLKITCHFDADKRRITDGNGREMPPLSY
jgi:predicted dehydrogenase